MARRILIWQEEPPRGRLCSDHGEKIRRYADRADTLWLTISGQIIDSTGSDGDFLKTVVPVLDVEILCGGKPILQNVQTGRTVPENHQPACVFIGKRAKQQRIGDAENRCIRSNADGQRQNGCQRESGVLGERPNRKAEILNERVHGKVAPS